MIELSAEHMQKLRSGRTNYVYCLRVERTDGRVYGYTEHDKDIVFQNDRYIAKGGFTPSKMRDNLGIDSNYIEFSGAFDDEEFKRDAIAGLFDGAKAQIFWVDWQNTDFFFKYPPGMIGETTRQELSFKMEYLSISNKLQQNVGRIYSPLCDAVLFDNRCRVNKANWTLRGIVVNPNNDKAFSFRLPDDATDRERELDGVAGNFKFGWLRFESGQNTGIRYKIRGQTSGVVQLRSLPHFPVATNDTFTMEAGCNKDSRTCKNKFNNILNFRGVNSPGDEVLARSAREDCGDDNEMVNASNFNAGNTAGSVQVSGESPSLAEQAAANAGPTPVFSATGVQIVPGRFTQNPATNRLVYMLRVMEARRQNPQQNSIYSDSRETQRILSNRARNYNRDSDFGRSEPDPTSPTGRSNGGVPTDAAGRVHGGI